LEFDSEIGNDADFEDFYFIFWEIMSFWGGQLPKTLKMGVL
jgi:hypothetical protein